MGWRATLPLAAALVLGLGALYAIRIAAKPLAILVIAVAIAEALDPPVRVLARWSPRPTAITGVYLALLTVLGLGAWAVVPVLVDQTRELIMRAPVLASTAQGWISTWDPALLGQLASFQTRALTWAATWLVSFPLRVVSGVTYISLMLFLSAYWLIGAPSLRRFVLSLFPEERRARAGAILHDAGRAMGGYVRGAAINALIMGLLAWVGLAVIGVDFPLVLGVLTMLGELVPVVGPILVAIPVAGVALLESPMMAVFALLLYAVLQQLEGHLLTPNIMRHATDVPQTLVLVAILVGGVVGGLLGVLAAIPLAAAIRVLTLRIVVPAIRRRTGAAAPVALDATGDREPVT